MKKLVSFILIAVICLSVCSCGSEPDPYSMLSEFVIAYGAEGVIYSPHFSEGEEGYIPNGLCERIYVFSGNFPEKFAVFLNTHPSYPSECGVFICDGAEALASTEEMCLERIRLLSRGEEHAFVKTSGSTVFYSTMQDRERAERIWREIIR